MAALVRIALGTARRDESLSLTIQTELGATALRLYQLSSARWRAVAEGHLIFDGTPLYRPIYGSQRCSDYDGNRRL